MKDTETYELTATCGGGTEPLVAEEIRELGGVEVKEARGVVSFKANMACALRTCLWSRYASRVLLPLHTFAVVDEDSIYRGAKEVPWADHLGIDTTFAVDATVVTQLNLHSKFAALRVKDAIVDQFRENTGERPSVEVSRPGLRIHLFVDRDHGTLSIDFAGDSLHKRGYRREKSLAPLKENLGAAIVRFAGWSDQELKYRSLVDPMCGSGTLLIEAALIYGDIAPGLSRTYFGFMGWKGFDRATWDDIVAEALEREEKGAQKKWPAIIGFDADPQAVKAARENIASAGLEDRIRVQQRELYFLDDPGIHSLVVTNLPFGERLLAKQTATWLYRAVGRIASEHLVQSNLAVFISAPELTDSFGLQWQQKIKLYNGPLQCRLLSTRFEQKEIVDQFHWQLSQNLAQGEGADFQNRLRKNVKRLLKTARKNGVSCFRVYDRDLAEYNVSIDLYEKWVHVQEFAPPSSVDEQVAAKRFQLVLQGIKETFGLRSDRIFIKRREKQKGKKQYQKKSSQRKFYQVREGNCWYLVNLKDYLDTGVFLDHRPIRERIFREGAGKDFLNLFGYTGTATVQAAAGGARSTTTVDLSRNYLEWARMNLAVNGLSEINNRVVVADCLEWLRQEKGKYGLIFVDPPTFSNTKKERRVFDVQRDHRQLLELAMSRLTRDGKLFFSTNFRKFRMDPAIKSAYQVEDITPSTLPFDFAGKSKIHRCWEITWLQE